MGDAIGYLEEKADEQMALKREVIEMRKQEDTRRSRLSEQPNTNAARYDKGDFATTRRTVQTAANKPTANTTTSSSSNHRLC